MSQSPSGGPPRTTPSGEEAPEFAHLRRLAALEDLESAELSADELRELLRLADERFHLHEENAALRARLERFISLDQECALHGLGGFVASLAKKFFPAAHQEAALHLMRLAYTKGACDEISRVYSPIIVHRTCPKCGKPAQGEGEA